MNASSHAEMAVDKLLLVRKKYVFFIYCEISNVFTATTHFLPVMAKGLVSFLHRLFYQTGLLRPLSLGIGTSLFGATQVQTFCTSPYDDHKE